MPHRVIAQPSSGANHWPLPVTPGQQRGLAMLLACAGLVICLAAASTGNSLRFNEVTRASLDQIADSSYRFDAMWNDFNGDGCYDAWIFDHQNMATSRLWVNRCDGSNSFSLVDNDQAHYYIATPEFPRGSGWVSLLDFNGDGLQDFWTWDANNLAARYVNATPGDAHTPVFSEKQPACDEHCIIADINGDDRLDIIHEDRSIEDVLNGTFLANAAGRPGLRTAADIDGDGWTDLLQPAAGGYWHNNAGTLQWRAIAGMAGNTSLMLLADLDNDGDIDIMTMSEPGNGSNGGALLYRNNGNASFTNVTAGSGLQDISGTSWWTNYGNTLAADLDNDGRQDIIIAGASYSPAVTVLRNLGNLHFAQAALDLGSAASGSESAKSRASVADFDNDGRLDILKTQAGTNAGIWRNTTDTGSNHWMNVRVRGQGLNSDGLGANLKWYRPGTGTLLAHMSVQASNQHPQTWLHTGVGANEHADLVITWPHGGPRHRYNNLDTNQELIAFPNGCLLQHWQPGDGWPLQAPAGCAAPGDSGVDCQPGQGEITLPYAAPGVRRSSNGERSHSAAALAGHRPAPASTVGTPDCMP